MTDVLVVGAGPVGLTMAAELARHGVRCRIVDRLASPLPYCRAIGVTPRTLEVWEDMGVAREMIDAGLWLDGIRTIMHGHPAHDVHAGFADLPYGELGLPQPATERILTRHLERFGIRPERGTALTALRQDADGVTATLARDGGAMEELRCRYLVGCDGAHSAVRHALGIGFPGEALPMGFMLGDVRIAWDLPRGMALRAMRLVEGGAPDFFVAIPLPEPGRYRVTMLAPHDAQQAAGSDHGIQTEAAGPDLAALQRVADELLPEPAPLSDLRWSSLFRISMRLADCYRVGRAFIAGDAAHIHPPTGGQGMNTGIQDAYNLAWKLALVLDGAAPAALLDSYEAERRPVGAEVVARTHAASVNLGRERRPPDRLADTQILVSYRGTRWVRNDAVGVLDDAVPQAGDRAPDAGELRRHGIGYPLRLFDLLRGTEHVLLAHVVGGDVAQRLAELADHVRQLPPIVRIVGVVPSDATSDQPDVPVVHDEAGAFAAAYGTRDACFLVRPDGYIGWRGVSWRDAGLAEWLQLWLPAARHSSP